MASFAFSIHALLVLAALPMQPPDGKSTKDAKTAQTSQETSNAKPPTIADILNAGQKIVVFTFQDFNRIDRPDGVFLPGADAAKMKQAGVDRPSLGGVTKLEIAGDLNEAWATLNVLVEARIDDAKGGDLVLGFQEAQCSKAELKFRDPAWDLAEFVVVEPAPLRKEDLSSPYVLRLDRAGSYALRLTLDVEIERGPVDRQLLLTLPRSPVKSVRLKESAVRSGWRLDGARRLKTDRDVAIDADGATLVPRLLPEESLDLRWRLSTDAAEKGADAAYTVVVRPRIRGRRLETVADFALQTRRNRREWIVRLPEGEEPGNAQVLQDGKGLVATTEALKSAAGENRVRVATAEPAVGTVKILLSSSRALPPIPAPPETATVEIAPPALEGVAAGQAFLLPPPRDDQEIRMTPTPRAELGVELVPADKLEAELGAGARATAYQFLRPDARLPLRLERLKPELAMTAAPNVSVHFAADSARMQADFRLSARQGRFETVQAALPANAEDVRASVDGVACSAAPGDRLPSGHRLWTLAFGERRAGESTLQIVATIPISEQQQRIAIPYLPDVQTIPTTIALTKGAGVQVVLGPEELQGFQLLSTRGASQTWLTLQARSRDASLSAAVRKLQGRSAAAVEHRLSESDSKLHVATVMRWENRVEPLVEIGLTIPEGVADAIVKGDRLAAPPAGLSLNSGPTKLALAAPSESATVAISYAVPLSKGAAAVPLATPTADVASSCVAELRAQSGRRPLPPAGWQVVSAERLVGELIDAENPFVGVLVRSEKPSAMLEWRSEPAGSLAELVVPRMMVVEELTSSGRRRGRLLAVFAHRRVTTCEVHPPPGCTLAEAYLDGRPTPLLASTRGDRPTYSIRLPSEERPCSVEVRYEAVCKSLAAVRRIALDIPKFGGDVVVDQVLWRIATPKDALLFSLADDVDAPAPNLWRFDRRLPGEWGFEPDLATDPTRAFDWLNGVGGLLTWAEPPQPLFTSRRWSLQTWGNTGSLSFFAVREPLWILAASLIVLTAAATFLTVRRRFHPWIALGLSLAVAIAWLLSPRAMAWFWIGARWSLAALAVAVLGWTMRALLEHRRRRRLAQRSLTLAPPTAAALGPGASSLRRRLPAPQPSTHE